MFRGLSENLIPRLRRFGRLMVADPDRADRALLDALDGCREAVRSATSGTSAQQILFEAAILGFEQDARALDTIAILPQGPHLAPPLLPAFWALPYEERLAACLLVVEDLEPGAASQSVSFSSATLEALANRALDRLSGKMPFLRPE